MEYTIDIKQIKKSMIDNDIDSITELAERAGITRKTCSDVMNGNSQPSTDVMKKIAAALNYDSEEAGRVFFATKLS